MTDILKDFDQKNSREVEKYLRTEEGKKFELKCADRFRKEINDLGSHDPTLIAFGVLTHKILNRNFKREYKIQIILHYSYFCGKEKYREEVSRILQF